MFFFAIGHLWLLTMHIFGKQKMVSGLSLRLMNNPSMIVNAMYKKSLMPNKPEKNWLFFIITASCALKCAWISGNVYQSESASNRLSLYWEDKSVFLKWNVKKQVVCLHETWTYRILCLKLMAPFLLRLKETSLPYMCMLTPFFASERMASTSSLFSLGTSRSPANTLVSSNRNSIWEDHAKTGQVKQGYM